jgi:phosphatidylglycerophosphate synthase
VSAALPRRPLRSRDRSWARAIAGWLVRLRVRPNAISLLSIGFAALAGLALGNVAEVRTPIAVGLYLVAVAGIQLRLLCNLFDGMVAIEGGMRSKTGEIWNDLPDRLADSFVLLGAGYALSASAWGPTLGWLATALAILTAYVRLLGGAAGVSQQFCGAMAKPQRMATITVASLLAVAERLLGWPARALPLALALIILGSAVTVARRTWRIARELEAK